MNIILNVSVDVTASAVWEAWAAQEEELFPL